ncbi:tonB-dependent hemoglobin/transferrin/lactoferrin receptor family protein, partial [Vibrio harveyi]
WFRLRQRRASFWWSCVS